MFIVMAMLMLMLIVCGDVQHPLAVHAEYKAGVVPQDQELNIKVGLGFQLLGEKEVLVDPHHDSLHSFLHLQLHAFVICKQIAHIPLGTPANHNWSILPFYYVCWIENMTRPHLQSDFSL